MSSVDEQFRLRFGRDPDWIVAAPGRVNLIGEHTDYNDGFVLPMAINRQTLIAAARNDSQSTPHIRAWSANLNEEDDFSLSRNRLVRSGRWTDYIRGVLAEFLDRGLEAESLDLMIQSDVPMGCGLSSSAALQVATARLLQQLGPVAVDDDKIAGLCQAAEQKFAGVPVGIMDQYCIAHARENHAVFLDCRTLDAEHIRFDDPDVAVLIVDSRVSRELRSGAYAKRRAECDEACRILGISHLRDANETMVASAKGSLGDVHFRRARHVTSENARTIEAIRAIRCADWARMGALMYDSHESLRRDFEVSCSELDTLVGLATEVGSDGGVYGSRMTGGGFGGCTVSLIGRCDADRIVERLSAGYRDATGKTLSAYVSSPAAGARVLERHEWGGQ